MRFLAIGDEAGLADMYLRLAASGHDVRVYATYTDGLALLGSLNYVTDWREELPWVRAAGDEGIILFETADMGELQDQLRREGFNVIGGSAFGDRLESDREFGQRCLRLAGIKTIETQTFEQFDDAVAYIRQRPRRYVFKVNGSGFASGRNCVGDMEDGSDIITLLQHHSTAWGAGRPRSFILMDHVTGVEVGVGAYFNGEEFLDAVVIDWEHKRFFNGDMGELTGEMGTLLSYENSGPLFAATLERMKEQLRANGYVGYININTIANGQGIWPLEFTCRFGNPGFAICDALHVEGWDTLFQRLIRRDRLDFVVRSGFAVGVLLTVPPFPYSAQYDELSKGQIIFIRGDLSEEDHRHLHLNEVEFRDGAMVAGGETGSLMVVTGCGESVEQAREHAYRLARRVVTPNLRYRTDIGLRFLERDRGELQTLGLWP